MSGSSADGTCPNCESDKYSISQDWKPFEVLSSQCYDCGFYTYTKAGIDTLAELNLERAGMEEWGDEELKPLTKPREQTKWAKNNIKNYF